MNSFLHHFKTDIPAGIVVFLVALPLCLGIALASGAPFFSGIISGIIGGIIVGTISGSRLSVSGPAAGLAALVLAAIHNIGDFRLFLCAVIIAGILQIFMALARLAGISNYYPSSVIKGMLTSIGILIIAKQIPHALGYARDEQGYLTELLPFHDMHPFFHPIQNIDVGVTLMCFISIAIILVWDRPFIRKKVKYIPGALVAVIFCVLLNEFFYTLGSRFYVESAHLVNLKSANSISEFIGFFTTPDFSGFTNSKVIVAGVMIAIIASLETLLSIEATDKLDPERQVTDNNRELIAQGIGNITAGLIGGLPITSVIVRSSANINAQAKSKLSSIFHGVLLFVCVLFLPRLLSKIPLSTLAAILLITGYKLCNLGVFVEMYKKRKYQFIPFLITVSSILAIDLFELIPAIKGEGLLIGVLIGLGSAFGAVLHGSLRNSHFYNSSNHVKGEIITMTLAQEVSFLNKASIRETLDKFPKGSAVHIDASLTSYIDHDVLELIREFKSIKAPLKHIRCELIGFKEDYYQIENTR